MSTATAPAVTIKSEQATRLRAEAQTLGQELSDLRKKLEIAQRTLGSLQEKRRKFTEDAARGKQPKPSEIATLTAEITAAQIPFDGLTTLVNEKQMRLDQARAELETLQREIADEQRQAARRARFDALAKQGREVTAEIGEILRVLLAEKLPALDAVRDSLVREFVNVGQINMGPGDAEATAARALIHELEGQFFDGPFLRCERKLLREGFQPRGDLVFTVKNLRQPRQ